MNAYMYLAMLGNQLLSSILQIIFLFCLNYDGIQQICKGFGWIIKIKRYFCSIKTIKI